jgi:diguanylate cyclase (GGDEF)-like protein
VIFKGALGVVRVAVIIVAFGASYAVSAAKLDKISIAYCADCVPFHFQNKNGRPDGMIIDFWRLWSEKTGTIIEFQAASWTETLRLVGDGAVDAHAGLFFSDERAEYLEYGGALTKTETHYFYDKNLPPIEDLKALAAYKVGVLDGDFVESFLRERLPAGAVVEFQSYEAIMKALSDGKLQVFAADTPTGITHLQRSDLGFAYTYPAGKALYQNKWLVAAAKGNTQLIKVIDDGMALITETERREISRKWIDLGARGYAVSQKEIAGLVLIFVGVVLGGALIWNYALRRRILGRTVELEAVNKKLESLSYSDGLTQLANRRHFDDALKSECQRARRSKTPLSVIMMDVDFFKLFNDHYGHAAGDECLKIVAKALSNCLARETDLVARFGGEEFVCLLPNTNGKGARRIAEQFLNAVQAAQIPHEYSAVADIVTISIGCLSVENDDDWRPDQLIEGADKLMYQSKQGGRNRISAVTRGVGP